MSTTDSLRNCPVVLCGDFNINLRSGLEDEDGVYTGRHPQLWFGLISPSWLDCRYTMREREINIYIYCIYVSSIIVYDISMKYTPLNVVILCFFNQQTPIVRGFALCMTLLVSFFLPWTLKMMETLKKIMVNHSFSCLY